MKLKKIATLIVAASAVFAVNADEITSIFTLSPKMTCANCEKKIKSNIRFEKGVKNIQTSLSDQTVTITYDSEKSNPESLKKAFKKIGYEASCAEASQCTKEAPTTCAEPSQSSCCQQQTSSSCCQQQTSSCCAKEAESCCKQ